MMYNIKLIINEMIITIRCFTCNKVLADIYEYYIQNIEKDDTVNKKDILDS